jgi:hypothetical protein
MITDNVTQEAVLPVINLTPVSEPVAPAPAQPKLEPAEEKAPCYTAITVSLDNSLLVSEDDEAAYFDFFFRVSALDADNKVCGAMVRRRVRVNKASLASEAFAKQPPAVYIEQAKANDEDQAKQGKSPVAKRLRELAGIPHKDNFV